MKRIFAALLRRVRGLWVRVRVALRGGRIALLSSVSLGKNVLFEAGARFTVGSYCSLSLVDGAELKVGDDVTLMQGCEIVILQDGKVSIGNGVYLGAFANVRCGGEIDVGNRTRIGQFVSILDATYESGMDDEPFGQMIPASVRIGTAVWIGAHAVLLAGVNIGDGAVIAAGSVVNRDIPANTVAAGNPARLVRSRI